MKFTRSQHRFNVACSGTYLGRTKTVYLFLRDGFVSGESKVGVRPDGEHDSGFKEFWAEQRALVAQVGDEIEVNDPFARERGQVKTEECPTDDGQGRLL